MANSSETFVLVESQRIAGEGDIAGITRPITVIKRVVRTYLSRGRADEDVMLLRDAMPDRHFDVQTAEHIDS